MYTRIALLTAYVRRGKTLRKKCKNKKKIIQICITYDTYETVIFHSANLVIHTSVHQLIHKSEYPLRPNCRPFITIFTWEKKLSLLLSSLPRSRSKVTVCFTSVFYVSRVKWKKNKPQLIKFYIYYFFLFIFYRTPVSGFNLMRFDMECIRKGFECRTPALC